MGPMKMVFFLFSVIHLSWAETCSGCERERDANDPTYKAVLVSTLSHYSSAPQGTDNERTELVKLTKVKTQVMNGIKYYFEFDAKGVKTQKLYDCQLVLFTQKWKGVESIDLFTCKSPLSTRNKRSLLGRPVELDIEHNEYLLKLKDSIGLELTKEQKSKYLLGIVQILKASQQVVAGQLTKITAEVAETNCPANGEPTENCKAVFHKQGRQVCKIEVWEKPWLKQRTVTLKKCEEVPNFCAGCPIDVSPNDEQANLCLKRTLFNLNAKSHSQKTWKLQRVLRVRSQVVAGVKYTFEFEALDEHDSPYTCKAVIVSQPWVSDEPMLDDFECLPAH